ncbi:MAG: EAL domain-containing protein [Alphaproteobacteria bacterium]|nr:EAL domain-containing protein [Alphaproteobacteria bacterium]MBV8412373.1 EAL domain-containing protein [Alphaproteobacteria bacterium]
MQRFGWIFLTAIAAGATIWCTHFVAMLGYEVDVPVHLDPVLTIVSLIVAIVGMSIGLAVGLWGAGALYPLIGGALAGGAISAMHYTGMAAFRVDGLVEWRIPYVVASVLCSIAFSAAAFAALCSARLSGRRRLWLGAGLFATAIVTLHFVAMTALRIAPLSLSDKPLTSEGMRALGLATALVGLIVIAAGIAAALIDRHTRSDAMQRLRHMAMNDALTGLPNRSSFQAELQRQVDVARTAGTKLAVVAIDLDRFKEINDVHGHKAGDDVLVMLADRMRDQLQGEEVVARLGGDEFVALTRFQERGDLAKFAARLDAALKAPVSFGTMSARVGAGIGVAVFPDHAESVEALVNNADLAMYRAKHEGSFEPRFYDASLDEIVRERRELANDLRRAIEEDQLALHYQVQTSITTREVTGYEALLRWHHPLRGNIPPEVFIPVAEESGLILPLGEWVLRQACRDATTWPNQSKVSVNVSPLQLAHADLPGLFRQVLGETGLPARRLEIELTETAFVTDRVRALHILQQIKALGVGVALDDFGTGFSSLETLRVFPFDKIKLDRFFISGLADSPQAIAIVRAVLALGKSLAIPVLAEGIETDEQLEVLRREGCDEAQGFLLGRPAPMPSTIVVGAVARGAVPRDRPLGGIAPQST